MRVHVLLIAEGVDLLTEVAAPVEQSGTDEGDPEIRGRLGVVAGEHPESTGVDRERGVDAVLGAEVGNGALRQFAGMSASPPRVLVVHVLLEAPGRFGIEVVEGLRLIEQIPRLGIERAQHVDRVVVLAPERRVETPPEVVGDGIPGPPEVVGKFVQERVPVGYAQLIRAENGNLDHG